MPGKFYGKYKAIVRDLNDPRQMGRIKCQCPSLIGNGLTNWCQACIPVAYEGAGDIALPRLGDTVWLEFEEGNINNPIWVGNFYSQFNTPLNKKGYDLDTRVISWYDCSIAMKKGEMTLNVGDTCVAVMTNGTFTLVAGRMDFN